MNGLRFDEAKLRELGYIVKDGVAVRINRQPKPDAGPPLDSPLPKQKKSKGSRFKLVLPKPPVRVRVEAFTNRPLDKDNCYGASKAAIDSLRYSGLILNDSINDIELVVDQKQVERESEERVEITLFILSPK